VHQNHGIDRNDYNPLCPISMLCIPCTTQNVRWNKLNTKGQ
jgi:hypothetical protein